MLNDYQPNFVRPRLRVFVTIVIVRGKCFICHKVYPIEALCLHSGCLPLDQELGPISSSLEFLGWPSLGVRSSQFNI